MPEEQVVARPGTRRRRWVTIVVLALVVFGGGGLAVGLTLWHLDRQYGPLEGGNFFGPYGLHGFASNKNGYSLHLKPAPDATGRVIGALANRGAHSVKITSIETGPIATKIEWSAYRLVNGGSAFGVHTPWHAFPATVPAHGTIRLLITIRHPSNCDQFPKIHGIPDARYLPAHVVHWESLLHDHTTLVDIFNEDATGRIRVC